MVFEVIEEKPQSLADILIPPLPAHWPSPAVIQHEASLEKKTNSVKESYAGNAHKPCSVCGGPERHKSKNGNVQGTLCTKCHRQAADKSRAARRAKRLNIQ